jgi:hypothetical protein
MQGLLYPYRQKIICQLLIIEFKQFDFVYLLNTYKTNTMICSSYFK